jgi:hypothetical protein
LQRHGRPPDLGGKNYSRMRRGKQAKRSGTVSLDFRSNEKTSKE